MPRYIEIEFVGTGVVGRAELLDGDAPRTCQAVWDCLPKSGAGSHAMYSGTVAALLLDDDTVGATVGEENATPLLATGDVVFTHYDRGKRHGHPFGVSEIYWAYDRYARPTIPGQFVPAVANVFGRLVGTEDEIAAFYDLSRRLHSEGYKPIEIRRVPVNAEALAAARALFDPTPGWAYLDTATDGLPPRPAVDLLRRAEGEWQAGQADWVSYDARVDACRADFAALIGASADEVALHPSFSIGIGLIAASLPPGAEVLVAPDEYGSVVWPMLVAARARGIVVREAPFDALASAVRPGTALVGVSLVQLHTGRSPDLPSILAAAEAVGARVLVDASQAIPVVDVRSYIDRIDYLGCAGYKHLLGPHGTSFFYVRRDRLNDVEPWAANWVAADAAPGSAARYIGAPLVLRPDAGRFDTTFPRLPWIATAESVRLVRGWFDAGLFAEVRRLAGRLASLVGLPEPSGSLVCVPVSDEEAALAAVLAARVKAAARIGHIRFAPHLWSTDADIERAAEAIEPHVSRR